MTMQPQREALKYGFTCSVFYGSRLFCNLEPNEDGEDIYIYIYIYEAMLIKDLVERHARSDSRNRGVLSSCVLT